MTQFPFAWEVKHRGKSSFLLGTSHHAYESEIVKAAYEMVDRCEIVYVESFCGLKLTKKHLTLPIGKTIADFLPEDKYVKLRGVLESIYRQFYPEDEVEQRLTYLERTKLWRISSEVKSLIAHKDNNTPVYRRLKAQKQLQDGGILLSSSRQNEILEEIAVIKREAMIKQQDESSFSLDQQIINYAQRSEKKIFSLETPTEYARIWDRMSLDGQYAFAINIIENCQEGDSTTADVADYLSGSEERFLSQVNGSSPHVQEYARLLVDGRTSLWYPKIKKRLRKQGKALIQAGVLHSIREKGIVKKLRRDGFSVRRV